MSSRNSVVLRDCQNCCIRKPDRDAQKVALQRQELPFTYQAQHEPETLNMMSTVEKFEFLPGYVSPCGRVSI